MLTVRSAKCQGNGDFSAVAGVDMRDEAIAIANVLLKHHEALSERRSFDSCLITYGKLCERAGVPWLTQNPGPFLCDIAEWCEANGWPPINALAVRADSRMPGEGYDKAPGCSLADWAREAEACIRFQEYPDKA
jgi:hypothetical protein